MSRRRESENEDDPEPFQSSGDEWDLEQAKREASGRRTSTRISRKPKRAIVDESGSDDEDDHFSEDDSSEEDEEEEEQITKKRKLKKKPVGKSGPKRKKVISHSDLSNDTNSNFSQEGNGIKKEKEITSTDSDSSRKATLASKVNRRFFPRTIYSEDYATGSFVILKKDSQGGDPSKHPCIWRIDGKALLQKYEAFDEENKVRHKNTSIYTGWSPLDKDTYAPITVDVIRHNNNNLTVEVHWDKLKVINADSD